MEHQIELPYNFIHGGGEVCNLLSGGDHVAVAASAIPFMPSWCSFPSPYDQYPSPNDATIVPPALFTATTSGGLQFPYHHGGLFGHHVSTPSSAGLMAAASMINSSSVDHHRFSRGAAQGSVVSTLFGTIQAEIGKMTAQEIMDAKALAASKSHSEAERRRRERINGHLAKLRSMLPNTTKTDKASLLAEVIQHVKELKRQTSEIAEESPLPSEDDELTVNQTCDEQGNHIVRATLCCEDRTDLLPDLIKALKSLKLRAVKAEISTVGGRVRNVLLIAGENSCDDEEQQQQSVTAIQDALKAVVEQTSKHDSTSSSAGGSKRQRTNSLSVGLMGQRSI